MTIGIRSMTGFGRGQGEAAGRKFTVEMRAVNARFLEVVVRLPRPDVALEDEIRRRVRAGVTRGRVEVFLAAGEGDLESWRLKVDRELALSYHIALKELAGIVDLAPEVALTTVAQFPGVLRLEPSLAGDDAVRQAILAVVDVALAGLVGMRRAEGERLGREMAARVDALAARMEEVADRVPVVVEEYRERLATRLASLLPSGPLDEARLAMEVALLAERADITEELVRLHSHCDQALRLLRDGASGGADGAGGAEGAGGVGGVGRPLEFLLQEMHREINTMGSKSSDLAITQAVLAAKAELEKLREQAQNVE